MRVLSTLALFLLATACATDGPLLQSADESDTGSRVVLLSEDEPPRVLHPAPSRAPVEVTQAEYETAMVQLSRQVRDKLTPLPSKRLEIISWKSPKQRDERDQLVQDYLQWCEGRGTPGDCLNLLQGRLYLDDEAKRQWAFALTTEGVWPGTAAVVGEVLDPVQLQMALMSTIVTTFVLLSVPEPISKAIVLSLTLGLMAYVGWDTLVGLIEGWKRLDREARQARTFTEVRAAGERYGRVMGEKVTRLLIMLATAALGGAGGKAINPPGGRLPGFAQASRLAVAEGVPVQVVGQVKTVKVTGRILTVAMEPGVVFMSSQGMSNGGGSSSPSAPTPSAAGSPHRLTTIESWRKPRFTEDGRILPFKGSREPATPIPNLGRNRAGQTVTDGKTTIRFDKDGFPEFEPKFETLIDDAHIGSAKPHMHFKAANAELYRAIQKSPGLANNLGLKQADVSGLQASSVAPFGYRWHHHQDVGRMQLITLDEHHLAIPHTGGMAIWGGGYPK